MSLVPVDTTSEVAVTDYLTRARDWLSRAVDETGPEQIAAAKAEIATAAEATKQLGLSKEIQLDAQEMVRRAEYALGKAIRKGQAEGTIRTHGDGGRTTQARLRGVTTESKPGPTDFAAPHELTGQGGRNDGIYGISDGVLEVTFEAALDAAKAEGNLSRANVVRKVKGQSPPQTRDERADIIADLAARGFSSRQMAPKVGVRDDRVREIARAYSIDIPADKVIGKTRRIDHTAAVESAVTELDNWASSLTFIDFAEVDFTEADEWVSSLTNSLTELRRFIKQIKEQTHV